MRKYATKYKIDAMDIDTKKELLRLMVMDGVANGAFGALFVALTVCAVRSQAAMDAVLCGVPTLLLTKNSISSLRMANKIGRDITTFKASHGKVK